MPRTAIPEATSERYVDAVIERARPRPDAMDRALAEIDRAFGFPAVSFKQRVRRFIRRDAGHPANRARYRARALQLRRCPIERALVMVDAWYARERQAFELATALGGGSRLSTEILREMRLIIRFMRAKRLGLQPVIADVLGEYAEAAE